MDRFNARKVGMVGILLQLPGSGGERSRELRPGGGEGAR